MVLEENTPAEGISLVFWKPVKIRWKIVLQITKLPFLESLSCLKFFFLILTMTTADDRSYSKGSLLLPWARVSCSCLRLASNLCGQWWPSLLLILSLSPKGWNCRYERKGSPPGPIEMTSEATALCSECFNPWTADQRKISVSFTKTCTRGLDVQFSRLVGLSGCCRFLQGGSQSPMFRSSAYWNVC